MNSGDSSSSTELPAVVFMHAQPLPPLLALLCAVAGEERLEHQTRETHRKILRRGESFAKLALQSPLPTAFVWDVLDLAEKLTGDLFSHDPGREGARMYLGSVVSKKLFSAVVGCIFS